MVSTSSNLYYRALRVLFVCIHNSARSQIVLPAEGFLHVLGNSGLAIHAESAGLKPGSLNPDVVTVTAQAGVDISQHRTKSVFELAKKAEQTGEGYDYIITVCDKEAAERCPIFPNPKSSTGKSEPAKRIHWSFRDPSAISKNESLSLEERQQEIAKIRDEIKLAKLAIE